MRNYPRVTQILEATKSKEDRERLLKWQQAVNSKGGKAELISTEAKENGTTFHKAIELFLTQKEDPIFIPDDNEYSRWKYALPYLKEIESDVLCLETEVVSNQHQYAGRLDCLAWRKGQLCVIDWKTSSRFKKREWIEDFFIQGAAYAIAAAECGLAPKMPDEIWIYVFSPKRCQVFVESVSGFEEKWFERLQAYKITAAMECRVRQLDRSKNYSPRRCSDETQH